MIAANAYGILNLYFINGGFMKSVMFLLVMIASPLVFATEPRPAEGLSAFLGTPVVVTHSLYMPKEVPRKAGDKRLVIKHKLFDPSATPKNKKALTAKAK